MRRSTDKLLISFVMLVAVCLYAPTMLSDRKPTSVNHVEAQADTEVQYMSEEITYEEVQSEGFPAGGSENTEISTTEALVAELTEISTTEALVAELTEDTSSEEITTEDTVEEISTQETSEETTSEALATEEVQPQEKTSEESSEETSEESSTQELTTETVVQECVAAGEETTEVIGIAESAVGEASILDTFLNQEEASVIDRLVVAKGESKFVHPELIAHIKTLPREIKPSCIPEEERLKAEAVRANEENFSRIIETYMAEKEKSKTNTNPAVQSAPVQYASQPGNGVLTASKGVNYGPSGKETYYNLNMNGVINIMEGMGYNEQYWVREDGVKMYGDYVMVAADLNTHPRGSLVESSLGTAIVVDTGGFAASDPNQLDIATAW